MKTKIKKRLLYLTAGVCSVWSCLQFKEYIDPDSIDVTPPLLQTAAMIEASTLKISFNEDICLTDNITAPADTEPVSASVQGTSIIIQLSRNTVPGEELKISGFVKDSRGNETAFVIPVYGFNDRIPEMVINEFTPQGSTAHPDFIEILAQSSGNLGGVCLYTGIPGNFDWRFIFPGCEVEKGEYLLIHTKKSGTGDEVNELTGTGVSGGIDVNDSSRDFWVEESPGLSGNNGVVAIYNKPGGACIDAVLYSNRNSDSDTNYRGFGSTKMLARAETLAREGSWAAAEAEIRPEDCVNPDDSTATRSISRNIPHADNNEKDDWHITPTSGASPGGINTNEVYK